MRDVGLQQNVLNELKWEPSIHAAEIGVAVKDGVVTLTGTVDSYSQKMAVEKAAKRVRGVLAVAEEIEVRIPSATRRTDADIARAALNALQWHIEVPDERIQVKVEDGWVTLDGDVDWNFQRDAAMDAVRDLIGVRGVTSLINVKPKVKVREIKAEIGEAFKRHAELDAHRITVDATDGKVTLSGKVHSWMERDEAARIAWAAPGVSTVQNQISVSP
ncbi:MAG TPA: BON domain-containing protein [Thermoanaerobaculia bacterium]|nr:BON domain-containing protein [Thermoanaerobaculia bacterium]